MLAKLIKYDFKAMSGKYFLMLIVLAVTGIVGSLLTFIGEDVLTGILLVIAALVTVVVFTVFFGLAVTYLYSTLSGKKSGFTYTLPVKITSVVLSKIINVIVWAAIMAGAIILFWFVFGKALFANSSILDAIAAEFKNELLTAFGEDGLYTMLFILGTAIVFQFIGSVCVTVFCVSLTCFPKLKNKNIGIATGVIGYFVIYYTFNILSAVILVIINSNIILSGVEPSIDETLTITKQISYLVIAGWSIISVIFYFLSSKMFLSNKNV